MKEEEITWLNIKIQHQSIYKSVKEDYIKKIETDMVMGYENPEFLSLSMQHEEKGLAQKINILSSEGNACNFCLKKMFDSHRKDLGEKERKNTHSIGLDSKSFFFEKNTSGIKKKEFLNKSSNML